MGPRAGHDTVPHSQRLAVPRAVILGAYERVQLFDMRRVARLVVFPESQRRPASLLKASRRVRISGAVAFDLAPPIPVVGDRSCPAVQLAAVPETTVHEHRNSRPRVCVGTVLSGIGDLRNE